MANNRIEHADMPYASEEFKAAVLAFDQHRWGCPQCKQAQVVKSGNLCGEGRGLVNEVGRLATPEWLALKSDWTIN